MKICISCKKNKEFIEFTKDNQKKDRLRPYCKDCNKYRKHISYLKNKKSHQEKMKRYYQENKKHLNIKNIKWANDNPEKIKEIQKRRRVKSHDSIRNSRLKYLFKITLNDYNLMLRDQNNVCVICSKLNKDGKNLYVDHCHKTLKVRGLLCGNCNTALGLFKDDPIILTSAIIYLLKVPKSKVEKIMKFLLNI